MSKHLPTIANIVGYQAVWFACVFGAGHGWVWIGPIVAAVFAICVVFFGGKQREDLRLLLAALPIGFALDSMFAASGWLHYAAAWPWRFAAPVWIWALWAGFILTLNHSLIFLRDQPWMAALFGVLGGPLAYWAAVRLHALQFGAPALSVMLALALGWGLVLPLLTVLAQRLSTSRQKARAT